MSEKLFIKAAALTVAFLMSVGAFAQTKSITGTVVGVNEPMIGATVMVKNSNNAVVTDLDGNYTIKCNAGDVLVFSFIGFKDEERTVGAENVINVTMREDVDELEAVVVLGYGAQARRSDLSASVGVIKNAEKLTERPITSTEGMLQGQIPGVTVHNDGGDPTSTPNIVIRGQGSRNGDAVLWVVDGVPGAPIVSNSDIESMVVLKDAASAAIYGAQSGAGGVILVTTKKASKGKPSVSYDGIFGVRQATNLIKPLNAEEEIRMREISYGDALPMGWKTENNPWVGTTRTNWMDEIFRTAFYNRHNVSVNMGNDIYQNRITFSYQNNDGVLRNTYKKDLGIRYNGNVNINKFIKLGEDFSWTTGSDRGVNTNSEHTGVIWSAIGMPASATVYSPFTQSGYGGTTTEDPAYVEKYGSNFSDIHGDSVNPVRILEAKSEDKHWSKIYTSTNLELGNFEKVKGLKFVSRFTFVYNNRYDKVFDPKRDEIGKPDLKNTLDEASSWTKNWKTENTLTYDRTFGDHTVGALLSTTADRYWGRGMSARGEVFVDESEYMQYLKWAEKTSADDYYTGDDANVSIISRLAYSYHDRYFVTASFRRDYAGRLPSGHNYGDFPAATAAWKISSEKFFNPEVVSLLKVRASWGRIGNLGSVGYNYRSALLGTGNVPSEQAQYGIEKDVMWGSMTYNNKALNNLLTWETSEQWDVGFDIDFIREVSLSFDYFNKRTYNLIQDQTTGWPATIGLDAMKVNQGEIQNQGLEMTASWNHTFAKDWNVWINGNCAYLKNKVISTGVVNSDGTSGKWTGGGSWGGIPWIYQTEAGQPLNSFYLIRTDGIFQSDEEAASYVDVDGKRIQPNAKAGDLKFVDLNRDGKIDDNDREYRGNAIPEFTYSLSAGFSWKDLSFSFQFQGVAGAQAMYVGKYLLLNDVNGGFNRSREILNAWSPTNTGSSIPRLSASDANQNFTTPSDYYLEDASYLRLKNLTVSYDFSNLIRKWHHLDERGSKLSVYFSGENLFTITKYSGMDPECGGYDTIKYPVSRILSLGLKLTY